jgi:hypothetical protein
LEQFIENNDDLRKSARRFYIKRKVGEERKLAERQREREREGRVNVRGRALWEEEYSVSNKIDCKRIKM